MISAMCSSQDTMDTDSSVNVQSDMNKNKSLRPLNLEQSKELRIVLIGKTGTGKSATGNSIFGKREFKSKICGSSVTNKCKLGINERFGRKIILVDTPGLFDTKMSNGQITNEIVKCIGMTAPGQHAILLIANIGRFTKEEDDAVKHFVAHFGDGIYNFLTVVFTRADDLENENMTFEEYVKEVPQQLKDILQLCDNRCVPFNNKLTGADQEHQVKQLINIIDDVVNKNGGRCFTNEMYEEAEKTLHRHEEEMKRKIQEEESRKTEEIRLQLKNEYDKRCAEKEQEKEEEERKLQQIRDKYQQRLNPSNLRDNSRRGFEEETEIFSAICRVTKVAYMIGSAFAKWLHGKGEGEDEDEDEDEDENEDEDEYEDEYEDENEDEDEDEDEEP